MTAGAVFLRPTAGPAQIQSGVLLQQPRPLAEFAMLDQDGQAFTTAQLRGRWSLVFAGFTHCPDVCPTTLGLLKSVEEKLGTTAEQLRVIFLTVDPERDGPPQMAAYVRYFSPHFAGVSGSAPELEKLAAQLGLAYTKVPGAPPDKYTMDHSTALVLIDPQARIAGYFSAPYRVETLADDLARIMGLA